MAQAKKHSSDKTKKKPEAKKSENVREQKGNSGVKKTAGAIVLIGLAICIFICMCMPDAGIVCKLTYNVFFGLFGWAGALMPVSFIFFAFLLILRYENIAPKVLLSLGFVWLLSAFVNVCKDPDMALVSGKDNLWQSIVSLFDSGIVFKSGGVLGGAVSEPLTALCGAVITGVIIFIIMLISFIFATGLSFSAFIGTPAERKARREEREEERKEKEEERRLREEEERKKRIEKKVRLAVPEFDEEDTEVKPGHRKSTKKTDDTEDTRKSGNNSGESPSSDAENTKIPAFTTNIKHEDTLTEEDTEIIPPSAHNPQDDEEKITKEDIAAAKAEIAAEIEQGDEIPEKPYTYPSTNLLTKPVIQKEAGIEEFLLSTGEKLTETLRSFGVETHIIHASHGPTVTRYELAPEQGVKISKITNLEADIALSLAAKSVRIEAPIPGKAAIGIEIPNQVQQTVSIRELLEDKAFTEAKSKLTVSLGKDISGEAVYTDLSKMPHLLIAGATGTGKSVCINSIIISLLYKAKPDEVKLILVDPKMVEFSVYKGIPHLLIPVVTDPKKAAGALTWAVTEMLSRYQMFTERGVRDFKGFNASLEEGDKPLPQIVIIIDELSDLMMSSPKEVEDAVMRLAQMARAAGMHLVIATQRPSADVITGTIKANIPSRIALAVSSSVNSRIILDQTGAETLLGKGDMLFDPIGAPKPIRIQGCFVSDKEVEAVVEELRKNNPTEYSKEILKQIEQAALNQGKNGKKDTGLSASGSGQTAESEAADDEMFDRAVEVIIEMGQASTSMLQRRIGLGYARAARLIDYMEQRGIVGPYQGSKPRKVLMTKEDWMEAKVKAENPATAFSDGGVPEDIE